MKRYLRHSVSRVGLLRAADALHYAAHRLAAARGNRRFVRMQPHFAVPPGALAYAAYGHACWPEYRATGEAHARFVAKLVDERMGSRALAILEWGCGAGRILRHLAAARGDAPSALFGVDTDAHAIAWCREHLPGPAFSVCGTRPPLPFADASFDVVYHYSVWTHLTDESMAEWARELARVLKPGGLMIGTTHGDAYRRMLLPSELARYRSGRAVVKSDAPEGRKHFLSFHPAAHVRRVLEPLFADVRHAPSPDAAIAQDVWIATR